MTNCPAQYYSLLVTSSCSTVSKCDNKAQQLTGSSVETVNDLTGSHLHVATTHLGGANQQPSNFLIRAFQVGQFSFTRQTYQVHYYTAREQESYMTVLVPDAGTLLAWNPCL
eukprot:scpid97646/ scgid32401/ 